MHPKGRGVREMSYQGKKNYAFERAMEKMSLAYEGRYYDARARAHAEREEAANERARSERECARRLWRKTERPWRHSRVPGAQRVDLVRDIVSCERNFHGGISYRLSPLETLKMVSASSIFGEPQYYRDGTRAKARVMDGLRGANERFVRYALDALDPFRGMTTAEVMEKAIDDALDADFGATLEWAVELRERYLMRLNPQVILVRAATHPGRGAWTREHPGEFAEVARRVMSRADDVTNQAQYWLAGHGTKRGIPAVLKRSWAQRVGSMNAYAMAKYGNAGIGLVDVVRICHAKGPLVDVLMREGRVPMPEGQDTWERLRASGMGWGEILDTIRMPHMALLRNLRGIFSEVDDPGVREKALTLLRRGVRGGRQFPFRYLSAWKAAEAECAPWTRQVQEALEECMAIACENLPELPGRSAFLADVSGSMWGTCTSAYGTMTMAEIANLSCVIGATRAEEGVVFPFADWIERVPVDKAGNILEQARLVGRVECGCGTEDPFWIFLREAIARREHWDNIFVYSDMQAGYGSQELYLDGSDQRVSAGMILEAYRQMVNPKVNVYSIQVGGYTNALIPEYGYRTTLLSGWTGKELVFADAVNRMWDELEASRP